MRPARIKEANANPGAPKDWDEKHSGQCGNLPVKVTALSDGRIRTCTSAWKPTFEELNILNAGGYITLTVAGWQVPVMLDVVDILGAEEID